VGIIAFWALVASVGLPRGDFANYWTAANLWWEGADLTRLYDYRWFTDQAARLGFGDQLVGFAVLSPPSAVLLAPLLPLGLHGAKIAWMILQGFFALGMAGALCRWLRRPLWMGPALLLGAAPLLRAHLVQGQFHLPVALFLCLGLWAWTRKQDRWAGISLGLAIGLKVHAWPLLAMAALAGRWKLMAWTLGTLLLGGIGSVAILGWDVNWIWLIEIAPAASRGSFIDPWNVAFQSMGHGIRTLYLPHEGLNPRAVADLPELALGLPAAIQVLIVGLTLISVFSWSEFSQAERGRVLAAASICALLTGPLLATYHLVLVLPALALGADQLDRQGYHQRAGLILFIGLLLAWWPATPAWPGPAWLIPLALHRFWLLLGIWSLLMPMELVFGTRASLKLSRLGVLVVATLIGVLTARQPTTVDQAESLELPGMPLIAADLILTSDGSLWFSGLPAQGTARPEGQGWMGYQLLPETQSLRPLLSDPDAHIWSPRATADSVQWTVGPGADLSPAPVPCLDGFLEVLDTKQGPQIGYIDGHGRAQLLTWVRAHHASPACDEERGRAWFLSDRGVGVRALRLWWVPLPESP
jgi:hypothetical protein